MIADIARQLYDYNCWAHARVWACALQASDAQWTQSVGYSLGSLRAQYVHVYNVDRRWFARLGGGELPAPVAEDSFSSAEAVHTAWLGMEAEFTTQLAVLTDADLLRGIDYDMPHRGGMKHNTGWEIIAHVVNHGTDHRAQILASLHMLGLPTTEQDMMFKDWGM